MLIFRFFSFGFLTFLKLTSRRKILGLRSWNSRRLRRTSRSAIETRSSISKWSKTIMPDQIDSKLTDWWECSSSRCNYYERYVGWPISAQRAWRSSPLRAWWSTKETKGKRLIRQRSTDDVGRQHAQEKKKTIAIHQNIMSHFPRLFILTAWHSPKCCQRKTSQTSSKIKLAKPSASYCRRTARQDTVAEELFKKEIPRILFFKPT